MISRANKKKLQKIRSTWTLPLDKYRNFDLISYYHESQIAGRSKIDFLDGNTWNDLNFDDIFSIIDRNTTPIGQQYLYHILHKYENNESILSRRLELAEFFKNNKSVRENIQLSLLELDTFNTNFISPLIFGELPKRPQYYQLFWILSWIAWISILLVFVNGQFIFLALASFFSNLVINHIYSKNIHKHFTGFASVNLLLNAIERITKIQNIDLPELNFFKEKEKIIKKIKKKIGSFVIDVAGSNELLGSIIEYLNTYFLYDLKKYSSSVGLLTKYQREVQMIFQTVGEIDATISLSSYLSYIKKYTVPTYNKNNSISFDNLYHPLIVDAIPNTFRNNKSVLITGSNMAGKTTFLKTVGVNIILAQTLNICLADTNSIPKLNVYSAIRREDNFEESKSYFFVEVEGVKNFIDLAKSNSKNLFLIDEIFRGTNTVERLAISTSVLKELGKNNLVFVTTHDIELQQLLENDFDMYHFSERVDNKTYYFDYKLQNGPTTSGNAIKLLEIKEYPKSIIEEANYLANRIINKNK